MNKEPSTQAREADLLRRKRPLRKHLVSVETSRIKNGRETRFERNHDISSRATVAQSRNTIGFLQYRIRKFPNKLAGRGNAGAYLVSRTQKFSA